MSFLNDVYPKFEGSQKRLPCGWNFGLNQGTVPWIMSLLGIESYDNESAYNAILFFMVMLNFIVDI
ncbi:hypothetical protein PAECIP111802_07316 [Paenibacillus allorhizosphaerae]|uniref:Uncharacterized protein n=1 Tax=Paenibacillus allorhizosphaerae TaxID=2849866 RepID=A0ABM8VUQ7_9BACL|nr:hypothetical protein PAECIP111802_07316 [Paenibacillus allorhizosphaerae]